MDYATFTSTAATDAELEEKRAAPRYISLIRAAKLILPEGEFVCVIRDVSQHGIKVKTFHRLPAQCAEVMLELQNGERFELQPARLEAEEASFTFTHPVEVNRLIREHWVHPKRQVRLSVELPVTLLTATTASEGIISNISQQGARIVSDARLARDQMLRIEAPQLPELRAKVRWRRGGAYGVVFENTFRLAEIAQLAARLQCPELLRAS